MEIRENNLPPLEQTNQVTEGTKYSGSKGMRIICVKSDISQLKELYGGEKGQTLAEGVWNNCNFTYRLRTLDD